MKLVEAHKFFKNTFNTPMQPFLDGLLSLSTGETILDIFMFDDWLHKKFGDYEAEGMSMTEVL